MIPSPRHGWSNLTSSSTPRQWDQAASGQRSRTGPVLALLVSPLAMAKSKVHSATSTMGPDLNFSNFLRFFKNFKKFRTTAKHQKSLKNSKNFTWTELGANFGDWPRTRHLSPLAPLSLSHVDDVEQSEANARGELVALGQLSNAVEVLVHVILGLKK